MGRGTGHPVSSTDTVDPMDGSERIVVRSRAARVVASLWLVAGVLLLFATVFLMVSQRRVSFDLPLALVSLVVGVWLWRRRVEFDRDGIVLVAGRRRRRLFWSSVHSVVVVAGPWWRTGVGLELDHGSIGLPPTWGTGRARREELAERLPALIGSHHVPVTLRD